MGVVNRGLDWPVGAGVLTKLFQRRESCPVCGPESGRLHLEVAQQALRGRESSIPAGAKRREGGRAVFLTTAIRLQPQRILERYALRWASAVYFKAARQHPGFLKEQANHSAAAIDLATLRFCRLLMAKPELVEGSLHPASGIPESRNPLATNATSGN